MSCYLLCLLPYLCCNLYSSVESHQRIMLLYNHTFLLLDSKTVVLLKGISVIIVEEGESCIHSLSSPIFSPSALGFNSLSVTSHVLPLQCVQYVCVCVCRVMRVRSYQFCVCAKHGDGADGVFSCRLIMASLQCSEFRARIMNLCLLMLSGCKGHTGISLCIALHFNVRW